MNDENKLLQDTNTKFQKKLEFARKITEQKIYENISNENYKDDPHLVTVISTTLNEDEFELDETSSETATPDDETVLGTSRSRRDKFLESVEEKIDTTNSLHVERLQHLKVQLKDHLQKTKTRKTRSRTDSKRKEISGDEEDPLTSRLRTTSPL